MSEPPVQDPVRSDPYASGAGSPGDGVSVIVTTYNGEPWIRGALDSILQQTADLPLEVLLVDDNSRDATVAVVESIGDPRIRVLRNTENLGAVRSRNLGVQAASHAWLAFNDQDDVWLPDKLKRQCAVLQAHPELDGVAGGYARLDRDGRSRWAGRVLHKRWSPSHGPRLADPPHYQPTLHGPCYIQSLLVRKAALVRAGGFRVGLPIAFDPDLFLRLGEVARLGAVEDPVFLYRLSSTSITGSSELQSREFLGGFAYMYAAQEARAEGRAEPDLATFLAAYQPGDTEVRRFTKDQTLRHINTVWVSQGLVRALWAAGWQFLRHPSLLKDAASRLVRWSK